MRMMFLYLEKKKINRFSQNLVLDLQNEQNLAGKSTENKDIKR
jgi:hypothetical protein